MREEPVAVLSPQYSITTNHTTYMPSISTAGVWGCPTTTGERPPPCAGLTFTAVDDRRAVVFGGYNEDQRYMNDIYIIDLSTMVHVHRINVSVLLAIHDVSCGNVINI